MIPCCPFPNPFKNVGEYSPDLQPPPTPQSLSALKRLFPRISKCSLLTILRPRIRWSSQPLWAILQGQSAFKYVVKSDCVQSVDPGLVRVNVCSESIRVVGELALRSLIAAI